MSYPFKQAKNYRAGGNTPVNRIVLHDMEFPERSTAAEDVAAYFARTTKKASAHYCVDDNSVVQCVRDGDIAFHAPPNSHSIGIEHAGYARQTPAEWKDAYSTAMLARSAILCAELCVKHSVPAVWLTIADLKAGKRGITSHNNVSKAFGQSTHTDPGPAFPAGWYVDLVRSALGDTPQPLPPDQGDDDMPKARLLRGRPGYPLHVFVLQPNKLAHLESPQTAADMGFEVVVQNGKAVDVKGVEDIGANADVWKRLPIEVVKDGKLIVEPPLAA